MHRDVLDTDTQPCPASADLKLLSLIPRQIWVKNLIQVSCYFRIDHFLPVVIKLPPISIIILTKKIRFSAINNILLLPFLRPSCFIVLNIFRSSFLFFHVLFYACNSFFHWSVHLFFDILGIPRPRGLYCVNISGHLFISILSVWHFHVFQWLFIFSFNLNI